MFKKIQDNTTWKTYYSIVDNNVDNLHNLKIPYFIKKSYAKLIAFYPFDDRYEKIYNNLSNNKKISFLFKYLIKISRKEKLSKSCIDMLVKLKNEYDNEKSSKFSEIEKTDRLKMYLILKDYDSILNLHLKDYIIYEKYNELSKYTKMIIDVLIDDKIIKIRKNNKKWKIENNGDILGNGLIRLERRNSLKNRIPKILDLKDNMNKISDNVLEWNKFIDSEVDKRIKQIIFEKDRSKIFSVIKDI